MVVVVDLLFVTPVRVGLLTLLLRGCQVRKTADRLGWAGHRFLLLFAAVHRRGGPALSHHLVRLHGLERLRGGGGKQKGDGEQQGGQAGGGAPHLSVR